MLWLGMIRAPNMYRLVTTRGCWKICSATLFGLVAALGTHFSTSRIQYEWDGHLHKCNFNIFLLWIRGWLHGSKEEEEKNCNDSSIGSCVRHVWRRHVRWCLCICQKNVSVWEKKMCMHAAASEDAGSSAEKEHALILADREKTMQGGGSRVNRTVPLHLRNGDATASLLQCNGLPFVRSTTRCAFLQSSEVDGWIQENPYLYRF